MNSGARLGAFSWFSGVAYERPDPVVMYAAYVCVRQCFLQKYPFAHCSVSEMVWCNPAAVSMCVDCMALCCVVPIFVSSVAVEGVCAQNFSVFCQSQLFHTMLGECAFDLPTTKRGEAHQKCPVPASLKSIVTAEAAASNCDAFP